MDHAHQHHGHAHFHKSKRELAFGAPSRTTIIEKTRVLVARATCTNDTDDGCHKPTQTPTMVIIVATVFPIVIALVVLTYLHRRNVKRLREEDAKDQYKGDDFGMEGAVARKKGKNAPEMSLAEKSTLHGRGMSEDVMSPYILPPGLHGSRESFHSLSRSVNDPHDPYRQVVFGKGDGSSIRSESRGRPDNGSLYTMSSGGTDKNGLLKNASRMSQSRPIRGDKEIYIPEIKHSDTTSIPLSPLNPYHGSNVASPPRASVRSPPEEMPSSYVAFKPMSPPVAPAAANVQRAQTPTLTTPSPSPFPRVVSQAAVVQEKPDTNSYMSTSSYGDGFQITPPSPRTSQPPPVVVDGAPLAPQPLRPHNDAQDAGLGVDHLGFNPNRLSMSVRPLPPDDPTDNPEQRANRIRSFYKEYFDDSKPEPVGGHVYNDYAEDYGSEYQDGAVFDSESGAFVVAQPQQPFAAPVTRRAMTPPPRAPPRFRSNTAGGNAGPPRAGYMSGNSSVGPPRNMSSMSGQMPPPRQPMAPPAPLASLPTPAKLTESSMVFDAADFAPPISYRDRQAGRRPDSPLGAPRPFSPSVRPHTPLAGAYDDLAPMPSPHLLRKSGTFTALDFAPPPRFRDPGGSGSDAGSIRSNRSGMSAAGRNAVRTGAYRVSRIPKEIVGTRDDLGVSLRPTMNIGRV
ncbi:hypothetical protein K504DRAFT_458509 [Pleomassaria siparia CBS 279.74]|uniref:Uncharacterized protein n=1 Tax=Pleomassaria siparia CBS 279.74 TaxID=1314801 RepID=A0A6G1K2F2_9PLEO|nr:hypothetical protein K504DRAFT_458509 [Pleomassaria siparia CBS 279.74]